LIFSIGDRIQKKCDHTQILEVIEFYGDDCYSVNPIKNSTLTFLCDPKNQWELVPDKSKGFKTLYELLND